MPYDPLPGFRGERSVAVLEKHGFSVERQRGSHCILKHDDGRTTVVPLHAGEIIGPGLFTKILRDTDLKREDFLRDRKQKKV